MPVGYMGRSGASLANYFASRAESGSGDAGVTPLHPGEDPLAALDPATRDAIVNWRSEPAVDAADTSGEKTFVDRLVGGVVGAAIGAVAGFLLLNGLGRGRLRAAVWTPKPMNVHASLVWAGIGAAIGAISGFARGRSPLEAAPGEPVQGAPEVVRPLVGVGAGAGAAAAAASHAGFPGVRHGAG